MELIYAIGGLLTWTFGSLALFSAVAAWTKPSKQKLTEYNAQFPESDSLAKRTAKEIMGTKILFVPDFVIFNCAEDENVVELIKFSNFALFVSVGILLRNGFEH